MGYLFRIRGFLPYVLMLFLNAFVDLGHKIAIQNTVFKVYDGQLQVVLTAIVNALILLPFIFLFSPSGFLADRHPRQRIMQLAAWLALGITGVITLCYYQGWFWAAFGMTLLLAAQSAVYSPAKYGYIKGLVGTENLAAGNGVVQAATTIAILAGIFVFSVLFEQRLDGLPATDPAFITRQIAPLGWALMACTALELWLAYRLPAQPASEPQKRFAGRDYLQLRYLRDNLAEIRSHRVIWMSIIGLSMFWAVSQVMLAAFPAFAKETLHEMNTVVIQGILACAGLGIMLGSIVAGRLSRRHIETGLIPVGALGIALALLVLPALESRAAMMADFLVVGFCGGLFIIPLNALIQYHADETRLGTVIAGNNWVQNVAMLGFLGLTVLFALLGLDSIGLFYILTAVALAGAVYTLQVLPHALARVVASVVLRQRYRLQVLGFGNLPSQGAVLLLGNHISWIDWAIVQIACPRPVRFVMQREIYNNPLLKPLFKRVGVIPIASGSSREALAAVNAQLKRGEVVCLFPEGAISRNGHLGAFHRGYERTVEGVDGVIVPFYLRGLWGSRFSRANAGLRRSRSTGARRDLIVAFGTPLPIDTPAARLKQKVFDLSITAWQRHTDDFDALPLAWLKTMRREGIHMAAADSQGEPLSHYRLAAAVLLFARRIARLSPEANVGILLPASSAGLITNLAVLLRGKTAVNLNYTVSREAIASGLQKAGIRTVYTSEKFLTRLAAKGVVLDGLFDGIRVVRLEELGQSIRAAEKLLALLTVLLLPVAALYHLFGRPRELDDPAAILFSSGSEGTPKGIVLSHRNLMANIRQIADVLDTRSEDVIMGTLPPFHSFGLTVTSLLPLIEGIPVVCHPDPTDALNIAKAVARYRATILCGTSTFFRLYLRNRKIDPLMFESLRVVVAGAEKLAPEVRDGFRMQFGKAICEGYGATETTPVASVNIPDRIDTAYWKVQVGSKPGTVGMPLPGSCFRIVDPESLQELPLGEDGLILISGTQVMLGYLGDEAKTREVIVEIDGRRWYKTGDKGHLDEDGFLTIVDRYSRFAKIGGEMISLTSVEERIRSILADEGIEVLAVNLPDSRKGEQIALLVQGAADADGLRQRLVDGGLPGLMLPSVYLAVDALPRLGSGKIDFKGGKELARQLLGAG